MSTILIPRHGESGPELYLKIEGREYIIPIRPGMAANLLDFLAGVAGKRLRGEWMDRVSAKAARMDL